MQRRRATGAGAGACECFPHCPPVSQKSPVGDGASPSAVVVLCGSVYFDYIFYLKCTGPRVAGSEELPGPDYALARLTGTVTGK